MGLIKVFYVVYDTYDTYVYKQNISFIDYIN